MWPLLLGKIGKLTHAAGEQSRLCGNPFHGSCWLGPRVSGATNPDQTHADYPACTPSCGRTPVMAELVDGSVEPQDEKLRHALVEFSHCEIGAQCQDRTSASTSHIWPWQGSMKSAFCWPDGRALRRGVTRQQPSLERAYDQYQTVRPRDL